VGKNGKKHDVSDEKYFNRLLAFVDENTQSSTFREVMRAQVDYLCKALEAIHNETQKGIHAEVTRREADSTVLLTYLLLADLVELLQVPNKLLPETVQQETPPKGESPTQ
jgi:hypothetical protein